MVRGLLTGYRVLDLAGESGAYGTKLLADLGAEVIKIEPPGGDPSRNLPPFFHSQDGARYSLLFAYLSTNKRSVTLDLDGVKGQELFRKLAGRADVVYETFAPGYLSERGIGYRELSRATPNLVWVAITPFGQTGSRRDWSASNLTTWAASGLLYSTGEQDRPPVNPGGTASLAYSLAALNGAIGALLALLARRRLGRGQLVDISQQEAALAPETGVSTFLEELVPQVRTGSYRPASAPNGLYPTQDGFVAMVVTLPHQWDAMAAWIKEVVGIDDVMDPVFRERRYRIQARAIVDEWAIALSSRFTKQAFFEEGQRRGIPVTPVNTVADLKHDPHLEARDFWTVMSHPVLGQLQMPGAPYRFSKTPWQPGPPPALGQDNEAIYGGELGLAQSELAALKNEGII